MKTLKHQLIEGTSTFLAIVIVVMNMLPIQGCNKSEDHNSYIGTSQEQSIIQSIEILPENDLLVSEIRSLFIKDTERIWLETIKGERPYLELNGRMDWSQAHYVIYKNGKSCIYVPNYINNQLSSFLMSWKTQNSFYSIIIKINRTNPKGDPFSGSISLFSVSGNELVIFFIENGKYVTYAFATLGATKRYAPKDCSLGCIKDCIDAAFASDPLGAFLCSLSCGFFETIIGAFLCVGCLGGTVLHCTDTCCDIFVD